MRQQGVPRRTRHGYDRPMALPPGPRSPAFIQSLAWLIRPIEVMESSAARYGEAFTLRWLGTGPIVFVSAPDLVREVFTGDPDVLRAGAGNAIVEPLLGKASLFVLDGEPHARQRKLLMPPLHGERMHAYAGVMRDVTDRSIDRWAGRAISLHEEMQEITLEVIVRTVFGVEEQDSLSNMLRVLRPLLDFVGSRASDLFTLLPSEDARRRLQVDLGPLSPWGRFLRLRREVDRAIHDEIARRRRTGTADSSILSLLLSARDDAGRPMTDEELRDELMTLLVAGHETTAAGLAWAFASILADKSVEQTLRDELARAAPTSRLSGDELARLPYIDAVCKEALRLRPILQIVARRLTAPLRLGPWDLPSDTVVAPCIHLVHRRADLYPDPTRFDPTRFLAGKPGPYSFLPFGGGMRRCIGAAFALYQMKVVLAAVLTRCNLRLVERARRVTRRTVTLVPAGGVRAVVESVRARPPLRAGASANASARAAEPELEHEKLVVPSPHGSDH